MDRAQCKANKYSTIFARPPAEAFLYIFTSTLLQWSYGFGFNMVQSNIAPLSQFFHATALETTWLISAYMAPNVSLSIILIKVRMQFGLRIFAKISILLFLLVSLLNIFVSDIQTAIVIRFFSGIAASPLSSLAFLYMMEAFTIEKKFTVGLSLNLMNVSLAVPLSRIISPIFLDYGGFQALYSLEIGLVFLSLACIFKLPLTPVPLQKIIEKTDFYSYGLIAIGLGLNAVVMPVGLYYGWRDAPWIGVCFLIAIFCLMLAAIIELNRKNPLINLRWLFSKNMLHIAFILFMFRLLLSEQSLIVANFFNLFGMDNKNLLDLYGYIVLGVIAGGLSCVFFYRSGREDIFHIIALTLIAMGAYIDSYVNILTRPEHMYLSQAMIGCGGAMFMPPAMAKGLAKALISGPKYVISFIAVFLFTQSTGGAMSFAFFNSVEHLYKDFFYKKILSKTLFEEHYIQQLAQKYKPFIVDENLRQFIATKDMLKAVTLESNILAFYHVFRLYFYIALSVLLFLILKIAYKAVKFKLLKVMRLRSHKSKRV